MPFDLYEFVDIEKHIFTIISKFIFDNSLQYLKVQSNFQEAHFYHSTEKV